MTKIIKFDYKERKFAEYEVDANHRRIKVASDKLLSPLELIFVGSEIISIGHYDMVDLTVEDTTPLFELYFEAMMRGFRNYRADYVSLSEPKFEDMKRRDMYGGFFEKFFKKEKIVRAIATMYIKRNDEQM